MAPNSNVCSFIKACFFSSEGACTICSASLLLKILTPVSGSFTVSLIWYIKLFSACEPSAFRKPLPLPSELMYTTAFCCNSFPWSSAHSVLPNKPGSSPSHAQYTKVRLGCQPFFTNSPMALASSNNADCPLIGSLAPFTHASWWLPLITHSSGKVLPFIFAITS